MTRKRKHPAHVTWRTYRRVCLRLEELQRLSETWYRERNILAKLAADEPQFYDPLEATRAVWLRDKILGVKAEQEDEG